MALWTTKECAGDDAHRDRVTADVMTEMAAGPPKDMPFELKRMAYGGFKSIVERGRRLVAVRAQRQLANAGSRL